MLNLGAKLKLSVKYLICGGLILSDKAMSDADVRPISEAWGSNASIADCYSNTKTIGVNQGGQSISDISNLVDTSKMTFEYKVKTVRVCELPQ